MAQVAKLERTRGGGESELLEMIRARSMRLGKFTLASGRESDLYLNLKPTMMDPRGARLSAEAFLARVPPGTDYVGGIEMGAVPVIAALAAVSDLHGQPVKTFFVRKAPKDHGTKEVVESHRFDEVALDKWMQANVADYQGPLTVRQFRGGRVTHRYPVLPRKVLIVVTRLGWRPQDGRRDDPHWVRHDLAS